MIISYLALNYANVLFIYVVLIAVALIALHFFKKMVQAFKQTDAYKGLTSEDVNEFRKLKEADKSFTKLTLVVLGAVLAIVIITFFLGVSSISQVLMEVFFYAVAFAVLVVYYHKDENIKKRAELLGIDKEKDFEQHLNVLKLRGLSCSLGVIIALAGIVTAYSMIPAIFSYFSI